jgi:hypothetical protein
MLEKIFNRKKKKEDEEEAEPAIRFGRYSDNNKSPYKVDKWNEADALFKEKKYADSVRTFFDYLRDDEEDNVVLEPTEDGGRFHYYQGSRIIRGFYNKEKLAAETTLASMPQPSVPVMRRLLEMNFTLYYSRYALREDTLVMMLDSDLETANPSKLYYGLKELATKADKQDDLLVNDFKSLIPLDTDHVEVIPEAEKEIKLRYFKQWIGEALDLIATVDADKYSGGIAYVLLALAYRIDFLIVPEGTLLQEIEKIVDIYFRKDDRPVTEKNQEMMDEFTRLKAKTKEEFYPFLYRSKHTFSIVTPQSHKTISDAIYNANQNIGWYKDNKQPRIAALISEYGIAYCQYSYSLPRPLTEYFLLFMMVNYPDYFHELGFHNDLIHMESKDFNKEAIFSRIESIEAKWKEKYPELKMKTEKLKFDDLVAFNQSFTSEIEFLNLDTKT